ncbi:MAG: sialate O-acetylesterase [Bacteroidaceae bacterium]|nr:sialate O-acetylesterase [Bacteroidaceae bacterium]
MKKLTLVFIILMATLTTCAAGKNSDIKKGVTRVACIGNSITYGIGVKDPVRDSYPTQLQAMLGEKYLVGRFGRSGATLLRKGHRPYMTQPEFRDMMAFHPDIAVIHLGINDTDPSAWPCYRDDFITDYLALIDSVRHSNPKCRIIMALLSPISDRHHRYDSGTRQWFYEIQDHIRKVADLANAQLIDFYTPLHHRPDLFPDRLHPSREGYGIIAHTVYEGITGDFGGLKLPEYWTSGMVLPYGKPIALRGTADAGIQVTVRIGSQVLRDTTGLDGKWEVNIDKLEKGGTYTLQVSSRKLKGGSKEQITLTDIVAGVVWLASGQSNMSFELKHDADFRKAQSDIEAKGENPDIRILNLRERWLTNNNTWSREALDSVNHLQYYKDAKWEYLSKENAPDLSAVAYYFARMLQDSLQCPVGIICNAIGGSGIESWIDRESLEKEFPSILRNWTQNDFIQSWVRNRAMKNIGWSTIKQEFERDSTGELTGAYLQRHPYQPCYLYEASIAKLKDVPVDGIIWYQGESNAHNFTTHGKLWNLMTKSWRKAWNNRNMRFIYAQLSSLNRPQWTWFRDHQRKLDYHYAHMVVTSDVGDSLDVHPRQKRPVGERMALRALYNEYKHYRILETGPIIRSAVKMSSDTTMLVMRNNRGLKTSDGKEPRVFEIAGDDEIFHPARAYIEDNSIYLVCPEVKDARKVRYAWQPYTRANVVNEAGLPMSTFLLTKVMTRKAYDKSNIWE